MYTQTGISYGGLLATAAVVGFARLDHLAPDIEADGEMVDRRPRDHAAVERAGSLAPRDRAQARHDRRHRDARSRDLRRRAERVRHRRLQEFRARRGFHRSPAVDEQGGSRSGARSRGRARRERRHGDADADPGRGQHLRLLLRAHHRHDRRQGRVPHRARQRARLLHHRASSRRSCSGSSPR